MGHCSGFSAISRNYIGLTSYDLRHRTSYDSSGRGIHGSQHSEHINSTFATTCDNWIKNLNFWTTNYPPGTGDYSVDWVGDVGLGFCKSGMHGQARAYDLTRIQFANGAYVDMNWSWLSSNTLLQQRRYLAVAAQCRRYVQTVITAYLPNESDHDNHIHFDDELAVGALRTNNSKDVTLIQKACNLLNGESLVVDGIWGSNTSAANARLQTRFNLECTSPWSNKTDAVVYLSYIVRTAFANKAAGAYTSTSC